MSGLADGLGAHAWGERVARRSWSRAVGRDEVRQIKSTRLTKVMMHVLSRACVCVTMLSSPAYQQQCILLRGYIHTVLGPFIQTLRADALRCSLQLCFGHGRCARRRPNSGRSLSSAPVSVSHNDTDSASRKFFQRHFRCQCYSGWTGTWCRRNMVGSGQDKS